MARRPTPRDLALVLVTGALVLVVAGIGVARALDRARAADAPADLPPFFLSGAFGHGADPDRAGIDPYAPPGLPEGVAIDRESGLMTGLRLPVPAGVTALDWPTIAGDYDAARDDVPPAVLGLDGGRVQMVGFLKAIYEIDDIRTFLLVGSHLACCFGTWPGPGGLVEVTLAEAEPAAGRTVEPIVVTGTLRIDPLVTTYRGRARTALVYYLDDASVRKLSEN